MGLENYIERVNYKIHNYLILQNITNIYSSIALINLPSAVTFNDHIQPIALPLNNRQELFANEDGVSSGWGVYGDSHGRTSDVLRFVSNPILTNAACSPWFPNTIVAGHICLSGTGGRSPCGGIYRSFFIIGV
jgi:hypothetical protein